MKSRVPGKASKASLVARGLASKSKPPAFKRVQKGQQKAEKESKPGYSLYTSDSEDQASAVDRGLNRCAALLSNILDNEDKDGTAHSRVANMGKPAKSTIKRVPASQPTARPGKSDAQQTRAFSKKVVIPTSRPEDRASPSPPNPREKANGASTAYNDRLVSSTPVLTAEELQRRQQLQRREAELQHELTQLKQRYELLQRQQSPSHQTEQKLQLQHSMMQELEDHQQKENSLQQRAAPQRSTEMQPVVSTESEKHPNSNPKKPSARRSLDYSGFLVRKEQESDKLSHAFNDSRSGERRLDLVTDHGHDDEVMKQGLDDSVTQQADVADTKKRVRIVSPDVASSPYLDEELHPTASRHQNGSNSADVHVDSSEGSRTRHVTPLSSVSGKPSPVSGKRSPVSGKPSPVSVRSRDRMQPSSGENQTRMIQYLVDELRALLESTGDLEIDRLLNEIDEAAKLLPYLIEKDKTVSATQDVEQAVQPLKVENAQLRRRLLVAHQKLKEGSLKKYEDKSSAKTDSAFELAACRSVNTVLQKQLTEEKNSKEEILRHRDQLSQNLSELQEEKKKFMQILSNKDQELLRLKREWQQDTSKLTVENKKLKRDLEAVQLSSEAEKKEVNILSLTLKQKDAEIERLKELTRGLQQSLTRLLSDIQQFQPKDLKNGLLDNAVSFEGLDNLLRRDVRTIGQPIALKQSPEVRSLATGNNGNITSPRTSLIRETPAAFVRSDEVLTRTTQNQRSVIQNKKHFRFADRAITQSEPTFTSTSGLSRPLVNGKGGSGYKIAEPHEPSARVNGMESRQGVLDAEDWDEERNGGDLSPLSSGEEEDFRRGLENLDANIARIQKSLRETALRA